MIQMVGGFPTPVCSKCQKQKAHKLQWMASFHP